METTDPRRSAEHDLMGAVWHPESADALLAEAIRLARFAHAGHVDADGHSAIDHPLRVMAGLSDVNARIVAALHDTLVGTVTVMRDLRALLPHRPLMAVATFEHADDGPEGISFQLIRADSLALQVRRACIADLADPARLAELDPFTRRRRENDGAAAARQLGTTLPEILAEWNVRRAL